MANTLFLYLESVLQSWGEHSRWDDRDTSNEPTKSGVVGLLGCASGISNSDQLSDLSRKITIGVRIDRAGSNLSDFQVVCGGSRLAKGGVRSSGIVINKQYLNDSCFLVAVRSDPDTIKSLENALLNPVWIPYLGRKGCVPHTPLLAGTGEFSDIEKALLSFPLSDRTGPEDKVCLVLESDTNEGLSRSDELTSRTPNVYGRRYVRYVYHEKTSIGNGRNL